MKAPALVLEGTAAFGGLPLFGPLRFEAEAGKLTCLLGPSGVGKSTLLRLVAGHAQHVAFTGKVSASDGLPIPRRAALMQQSDMLLPWLSVMENVCIGQRLRGETADHTKAHDLIQQVGLEGLERRRPATLSGGQRQRVALARTLMEARPIVLLDEPFSSLDAKTRMEMQALALRLLAGKTTILVTHDVAEAARLADQVVIMTERGLIEVSAPKPVPPRAPQAPEVRAFALKLTALLLEAAA